MNVQIKVVVYLLCFYGEKAVYRAKKKNSIRCREITQPLKTQMQKIRITENQIQTWMESCLLHNSIIKGDICVHLVKCSLTVVAV